jgi:hypothetical protein
VSAQRPRWLTGKAESRSCESARLSLLSSIVFIEGSY